VTFERTPVVVFATYQETQKPRLVGGMVLAFVRFKTWGVGKVVASQQFPFGAQQESFLMKP
jgi:hypothetical protein